MANVQLKDSKGNPIYPITGRLGETWISIDGIIPAGGIPYDGEPRSKKTFKSLWNLIKSKAITEAEWQAEAQLQQGDCYKYADMSVGNDNGQFRMPKISHYLQSGGAGWIDESLPNIRGTFRLRGFNGDSSLAIYSSEAFQKEFIENKYDSVARHGVQSNVMAVSLDASKTEGTGKGIYQDGAHVQPFTNKVLLGVYAIGVVSDVGNTELTQILSELSNTYKSNSSLIPTANGLSIGSTSNPFKDIYVDTVQCNKVNTEVVQSNKVNTDTIQSNRLNTDIVHCNKIDNDNYLRCVWGYSLFDETHKISESVNYYQRWVAFPKVLPNEPKLVLVNWCSSYWTFHYTSFLNVVGGSPTVEGFNVSTKIEVDNPYDWNFSWIAFY